MARRPAPAALPRDLVLPSVRIERFFRKRLRHVKGAFAGRPFALEPWQLEDLRRIYDPLVLEREPASGTMLLVRQVREALIGVAKKNGKSHWAAGLGLYHLTADGYWRSEGSGWVWVPEGGAEVFNVAASKDQAKVVFALARQFVLGDPILRTMCQVYKDAIEVPETGAVWRVLAADARLAHGPNPSAAIIDEIWAHRDPELYEAFASAGGARPQPLVLTITTAGWDQGSIAYQLYRAGRAWERSKRPDPRRYFRWYQAPDGCRLDDRRAWRAANPSRWITPAYLRDELRRAKSRGLELQFRRWHLNQWTTTKELAIPAEAWDACAGRPRIPQGAEVVIGVDTAPKRDSTGIVLAHRDASGVHHWRARKMSADPETGYLDYAALEDAIREACRTYTVRRILVDPYNMTRSMLLLAEEGLPIEEFPQGDARMVPASMNLFELVMAGRLRHGGAPELREAVLAAAKRVTERGWRLHKRTSSGVIDVLVAGAMASYELERAEEEPPPPEPNIRLFEL
ncbi:MAG TPA: terminase large subunit [Actinomycetota bacterium]|nr:terminase large subunit [Actinomycetota bacterium]